MRVPVISTLIVGLAMAAMVALGVWQLQRRDEKESLIARFRTNAAMSSIVPVRPIWENDLFRKTVATCTTVLDIKSQAGRGIEGTRGWRKLATCTTGANAAKLVIDLGVSTDPNVRPAWTGGPVQGMLTEAPTHSSAFARLLGGTKDDAVPMLIADTPAPGLIASASPSPDTVPNNHFAYAIQWFLFAGMAGVIYAIALRRRLRAQAAGRTDG